jgi:hypothetical protein
MFDLGAGLVSGSFLWTNKAVVEAGTGYKLMIPMLARADHDLIDGTAGPHPVHLFLSCHQVSTYHSNCIACSSPQLGLFLGIIVVTRDRFSTASPVSYLNGFSIGLICEHFSQPTAYRLLIVTTAPLG